MGNSYRLAGALCVALCALAPAAAIAQRTIVVEPHQIERTYSPGDSPYKFRDSRSWNEPVSTQGGRVNVPVTSERKYGLGSAKSFLRNALKYTPANMAKSIAFAGAAAAAGYALDTALDGWAVDETQVGGYPAGGYLSHLGAICNRPPSESLDRPVYYDAFGFVLTTAAIGPQTMPAHYQAQGYLFSGVDCRAEHYGWQRINGYWPLVIHKPYQVAPGDTVTHRRLITDAEMDALGDGFSDSAWVDMAPFFDIPATYEPDAWGFSGPASIDLPGVVTTSTDPVTGDTIVSDTSSRVDLGYGTSPLSITTTHTSVTNIYNNGTLVKTETKTEKPVATTPLPETPLVPTDCEFMPTVCAFLDWFREPDNLPEPDLPTLVEDDDWQRQHSVTVSAGAVCPAPLAVDTQIFGTLYIHWDPLCQLLGYVSYLIMASAYLSAAYITLRVRRN